MPTLYIITGPNGSGKSTVGPAYLPTYLQSNYSVFDGDKLYAQKMHELHSAKIASSKEARNIAADFVVATLEALLDKALAERDNFIYEGHFPSYATWKFPKRFKDAGYFVEMLFLGLRDPDISEMRVGIRTKKGGHNVPRYDIENNFYGNLEMLNEHYQILDHLQIVDTSFFRPKPLAAFKGFEIVSCVKYPDLPEWFVKYLPTLANQIKSVDSR
ncbi:zeta toxin family protein [Mucilaginibacter pedocola]|uniref:Zeta toxin domain-containing protein n=1 Tax=Mucilaginibacter pedocola TaxID=1792845 RepID=A0A1S9P7T6_9SPHI|nr:zeta toxin family protein [Mucilaginibacter pedocola]OOQ56999.1 hypothetical protein BC343_15780 [Mucilaginibacter pedocola]